MTVNRGPGVAPIAGVGTTTLEHRLQLAGLYAENAPGVPRSGVLAQATDQLVVAKPDWSYDVGPAALVISRTASEGVYTPTLTGTTTVATDAAPATDSRWDLIYTKQNDQAKGDADNAAVIGVQKGAVAASPAKPTANLPAGAYVLAEARIFAGTTGTIGGSNTIAQSWVHTAARGASIRVRTVAERDAISPYVGLTVRRLDLARRPVETWDGAAWTRSDYWESAADVLTFGPGWTALTATHRPRLRRIGNIVHLYGGVSLGSTASVDNILTIPAGFLPTVAGNYFVGSALSSQGAAYQLLLASGVLKIPAGYFTGTFPVGSAVPVVASWPID